MGDETDRFASIWAPIEAGEAVQFGPGVALGKTHLQVWEREIPLNTLRPLSLDDQGAIVVRQLGAQEPLLTIGTADLVDVDLLLEAANRLVCGRPYAQRRSETGWPPGSIGDVSAGIGYDVRDLKMMGYSDEQIRSVSTGESTVEELLKRPPDRGGA